jgi:cytochrome c2
MRRPTLRRILPSAILAAAVCAARAEVVLPGTQPRENDIEFGKVDQCRMCHSLTKNGPADPFSSWEGGMMVQAARDPVFRAALAVANQDIAGIGEFCVRCHAPRGWLEGRSTPADGSALLREDLHGVSCDFCHHMLDPLGDEAKTLAKSLPPGYGNAMMVVDPKNVVRGPYDDSQGAMPHSPLKSPYHATSQLCAVCHNVSNPAQATDVNKQPPHTFGIVERTYSEWALSDFAKRGPAGTCQSCHYPAVEGGGFPTLFGDRKRAYFVWHGPLGGSTWVQDAVLLLWPGQDINRRSLDSAKERTRRLLGTAAALDLTFPAAGKARLRITNRTGHKLPTGYPEGRRMWVNVRFFDAAGKTLKEIGQYGEKKDTVLGAAVRAPTLLDPEATTVYESLPAISEAAAKKFGRKAGPSFHFVLNDVIAKDNRIPPEGFKNAAFAEHLCQPVGATYADGQYWDDVDLTLPDGAARVAVRLMYQSVSWEYVKFLAEEDKKDDWGKRLYDAWSKTGKCPPEAIAEIARDVAAKGN